MKVINTALCSFGMSGWVFHAPFIRLHPGFNLYGVFERTKNLAEQKYPGVKTFRSLEEMLADDNIELVVVNTPNKFHYDYAKQALLANKHVIVEKPFTITATQGQELIDVAKKQNKKLSVYQNRRYDSDYKTIKKVLDAKLLGDIVEAEFHFDRYVKELSYKAHKEVAEKGNGALYDLGSHIIDQALQLFGKPGQLFADIRIVRPISKVDDYFDIILYYPRLRVILRSSYVVREPVPGYVLHGFNGSFLKAKTNVQEEALQAGAIPGSADWGTEPDSEKGLLHIERQGEAIREYITSEQGNYADYYQGIYDAIVNNKPVPVSAEDGLKVIKIIEKAFESNDQKKVVDVVF